MHRRLSVVATLVAARLVSISSAAASAQTYPDNPIALIVPSSHHLDGEKPA